MMLQILNLKAYTLIELNNDFLHRLLTVGVMGVGQSSQIQGSGNKSKGLTDYATYG